MYLNKWKAHYEARSVNVEVSENGFVNGLTSPLGWAATVCALPPKIGGRDQKLQGSAVSATLVAGPNPKIGSGEVAGWQDRLEPLYLTLVVQDTEHQELNPTSWYVFGW